MLLMANGCQGSEVGDDRSENVCWHYRTGKQRQAWDRFPRGWSLPRAWQCLGGSWTVPFSDVVELVVRHLDSVVVADPFQANHPPLPFMPFLGAVVAR